MRTSEPIDWPATLGILGFLVAARARSMDRPSPPIGDEHPGDPAATPGERELHTGGALTGLAGEVRGRVERREVFPAAWQDTRQRARPSPG